MTMRNKSPWTGEVIYEFQPDTEKIVEEKLSLLERHFQVWSKLDRSQRLQSLNNFWVQLKAQSDVLAELITLEMGKPLSQAKAEVKKCIDVTEKLLQKNYAFLDPQMIPSNYRQTTLIHEPVGLVLAIMPWNFPLWQALRMILPALLTGNVVLLKHSELTPQLGDQVAQMFAKTISPTPVVHSLFNHELTEMILKRATVGGVSLTGSTAAGVKVAEIAGRHLKKGVFELGGSDPYLVLDDADFGKAAESIVASRMQNTGQSCIAAKRVLVSFGKESDFINQLIKEFEKYNYGNPLQAATRLGPLASLRHRQAHEDLLAQTLKVKAAAVVYQKKSVALNENTANFDSYILKSLKSDYFFDKEFFAPVLNVFTYKSEAEAIQLANSTQFGLGGAVFSSDEAKAQKIAMQIQSGLISINDLVKSELNIPFGGYKLSGFGREMGDQGFLEFTQTKAISLR